MTTFEVVAILTSVDLTPIRSTYTDLDEALAVAAEFRACGWYARTRIAGVAR